MNFDQSRRTAISTIAASLALNHAVTQAKCPQDALEICNVTHLNTVRVAQIKEVRDAQDVREALRHWPGEISIGGGRYSMGGQTAAKGGLQLDLRSMAKLLKLDPSKRVARVQAGMRWRDLQSLIDPHNLSVRTMQSYSNFTVGGSVSVNCHGRYVGHGPISESIRALQMVLPDGEVLEATRQNHSELFHSAIGGYGGAGIVTEVELELDENFKIERKIAYVPLEEYADWIQEKVLSDPQVLLHNADLVAPHFDRPRCITWVRSEKALTVPARLTDPHAGYAKEKTFIWAMTELPGGASLRRKILMPMEESPSVVWRNFEASLDVAQLEPMTRSIATYVLQEYFIPERNFARFSRQMSKLMQSLSTGTLNVSIRHARADPEILMSWAQEDVFSFVVYYKQRIDYGAQKLVAEWTRAMIDLALKHEGTYYLPYQLHATQDQFDRAYPKAENFRSLRKQIGATRLTNTMWSKYSV